MSLLKIKNKIIILHFFKPQNPFKTRNIKVKRKYNFLILYTRQTFNIF